MIENIIKQYNIEVKGIIHVGAHKGQEVEDYLWLTKNVWLWEPIPSLATQLKKAYPDVRVSQVAAWHENGHVDFWVTSFSEGSSPLYPLEHEVVDTLDVVAKRLDYVDDTDYNILVIDTQGSELSVLKGCDLKKYDLIVVETNSRQRYENSPLRQDIFDYLGKTHNLVDEKYHSEDKVISDAYFVSKLCGE